MLLWCKPCSSRGYGISLLGASNPHSQRGSLIYNCVPKHHKHREASWCEPASHSLEGLARGTLVGGVCWGVDTSSLTQLYSPSTTPQARPGGWGAHIFILSSSLSFAALLCSAVLCCAQNPNPIWMELAQFILAQPQCQVQLSYGPCARNDEVRGPSSSPAADTVCDPAKSLMTSLSLRVSIRQRGILIIT